MLRTLCAVVVLAVAGGSPQKPSAPVWSAVETEALKHFQVRKVVNDPSVEVRPAKGFAAHSDRFYWDAVAAVAGTKTGAGEGRR